MSTHIEDLTAEIAAVEAHLARSDTKAALLLGLAGAGATAGPAVLTAVHLPLAGAVAAWVAVAGFVAAAAVLTVVVRPWLKGDYRFIRYAQTSVADVPSAVASTRSPRYLAARLVSLSMVVLSRYRRIRLAVDLILASLAASAVSALLTAVTH